MNHLLHDELSRDPARRMRIGVSGLISPVLHYITCQNTLRSTSHVGPTFSSSFEVGQSVRSQTFTLVLATETVRHIKLPVWTCNLKPDSDYIGVTCYDETFSNDWGRASFITQHEVSVCRDSRWNTFFFFFTKPTSLVTRGMLWTSIYGFTWTVIIKPWGELTKQFIIVVEYIKLYNYFGI